MVIFYERNFPCCMNYVFVEKAKSLNVLRALRCGYKKKKKISLIFVCIYYNIYHIHTSSVLL